MRLDVYLVKNQYYDTRNKAKAAILNDCVLVNNIVVDKPNYEVKPNDQVTKQNTEEYVSRGAYKLLEALKH
jgi:23S rRNA (cytidine1920-2'-O)/16S rRNA (cytidine1409-2'-O)-methyltransferase